MTTLDIQREAFRKASAELGMVCRQPVDRFLAEMEFAEKLALLVGRESRGWDKLFAKAWGIVNTAVATGVPSGLAGAVESAEKILAPVAEVAKTFTIHCVGHAHIDMNWRWAWSETVAITNDTVITVLKLMEEFPEFRFSQSQVSIYAILRDFNPELFEQVKQRVKEGRWEVTASQWVEGDKNLSSGESLARHLLYSRQFFKKYFDLDPEDVAIDWEPDMFGHSHAVPAILRRGAVSRYYLYRQGGTERPPVFWWQAKDGSRVLVYRDFKGYLGPIDPQAITPNFIRFVQETGFHDYMWVYGVGDHGGGPTRRDLMRAMEMAEWPVFPRLQLTTTNDYYTILEQHPDRWPVVNEELNFEFTGCYTTQALVKKGNRYGENYCLEAETAAVLAELISGRACPSDKLREAWTDVLFGQFHDILPGSGVHWTRGYQSGLFQKIGAITGMIKTHSWRAIAAMVDTSFCGEAPSAPTPAMTSRAMGGGPGCCRFSTSGVSMAAHVTDGPRPFVAFNTTARPRSEVSNAIVWDADTGICPGDIQQKSFVARTADGRLLPTQKFGAGEWAGHRYLHLFFPVEVPALGYTTVVLEEGRAEAPVNAVKLPPTAAEREAPPVPSLENDKLLVEFDPCTGGIRKLVDKVTGRDLACADSPLGILEYVLERPRSMSAWLIAAAKTVECPLVVHSFEPGHRGPLFGSWVAKLKVKSSDIELTYSLSAGSPALEIEVRAKWLEAGGPETGTPRLNMKFPLAVKDAKGVYETQFGAIARDLNHGEEVPALRWVDIRGKAPGGKGFAGLALLNDCKYGHSLDGSTLRLTLIRSSYEPDPLPDVAEHELRLALVPHGTALSVADLTQLGAAFNHPLEPVSTDIHPGKLPPQAGLVSAVSPTSAVVSSLRKVQDGDGYIVTIYETAGKKATAALNINPVLFGKVKGVVEVDMMERPLVKSSARINQNGVQVALPAYGIVSVKVTGAQPKPS
ncbi:MAG: glycoside hydrolase family 38 C-terminal domain-containing protein [bacterium]